MNKKQIDFLIENGFEEFYDKAEHLIYFAKTCNMVLIEVYYNKSQEYIFYDFHSTTTHSLKSLKAARKEIEMFERLCINLEELKK